MLDELIQNKTLVKYCLATLAFVIWYLVDLICHLNFLPVNAYKLQFVKRYSEVVSPSDRQKVRQSVTDVLPFRWRTDDWRKHWNSQKHWRNKSRQNRFSAVTQIVTKQEQDDTLHKFMCAQGVAVLRITYGHSMGVGICLLGFPGSRNIDYIIRIYIFFRKVAQTVSKWIKLRFVTHVNSFFYWMP